MLALLLALQTAAPPPAAAVDTIDSDLRCVAVLSYAVSKADDAKRDATIAGTMYFVGRIDARAPGYDYQAELGKLLRDEARVRALAADAARCGAILKSRGAELQRMGQALQQAEPPKK